MMNTRLSKLGFAFLLSFFVSVLSIHAQSDEEISLFDFKGRAVAYIAEDRTIYLWDGKPVAYLDGQSRDDLDIYGFNGKHLGWLKVGIVYDADGYAVGGIKEVFRSPTQLEPIKGLKELKPLKSLKELRPMKPLLSKQWSETPLKHFLREGADS
jgi:hypothetical protein